METSFSRVIREHLELRDRNAKLDGTMPLDRYRPSGAITADPATDLDDTAEIDASRLALSGVHGSGSPDPIDPSWRSARSFNWGD